MSRMLDKLTFIGAVTCGRLPDARMLQIQSFLLTIKDGVRVSVTIERERRKHTDAQRGYWWAVIVAHVAEEVGLTPDEAHEQLLWELLPEKRRDVAWGDHQTQLRASFKDLTTVEVAELFERAWRWAAMTLGLVIPSPGEYGVRYDLPPPTDPDEPPF